MHQQQINSQSQQFGKTTPVTFVSVSAAAAGTTAASTTGTASMRTMMLGQSINSQSIRLQTGSVQLKPQQQHSLHTAVLLGSNLRVQSQSQSQQLGGNSVKTSTLNAVAASATAGSGGSSSGHPQKLPQQHQQARMVFVQGGGHILLPHGFHGGSVNVKGLKVIPMSHQQSAANDITGQPKLPLATAPNTKNAPKLPPQHQQPIDRSNYATVVPSSANVDCINNPDSANDTNNSIL